MIDTSYPYYCGMRYFDIKECCKEYGKSSSSINRVIRKIKDNDDIKEYEGHKTLTYITLPNKVKKVLLLKIFMDKLYERKENNNSGGSEGNDRVINTNERIVDILENQLKVKDNQIETLNKLLQQQQKRIELFSKMVKLTTGSDSMRDMNESNNEDTETQYNSVFEDNSERDDSPNDSPNDSYNLDVETEEKDFEVVTISEEERLEEKKKSFLQWIQQKK
jgi:uncharacterized coiled-coil protein SlyX